MKLTHVDESGFEADSSRPYAWSKRGKKSYGERSGKRGTRTSLVAAKGEKELLAPVLSEGSTNAVWFNRWLKKHLIPELRPNSTLILDKGLARMCTAFHRKNGIFEIADEAGHQVLFLPPYSPDLNRIEQDFAIIKKRRTYSAPGTSLDDIIKSYGN